MRSSICFIQREGLMGCCQTNRHTAFNEAAKQNEVRNNKLEDIVKNQQNHHHHNTYFMELGHLLTRSGLTYPEVSSKVYHDSFCQLESSVSLPWVIYFEVFYLHVASTFSCIPVICPKLVLFLTPLQFVHLFCNLSKCICRIERDKSVDKSVEQKDKVSGQAN